MTLIRAFPVLFCKYVVLSCSFESCSTTSCALSLWRKFIQQRRDVETCVIANIAVIKQCLRFFFFFFRWCGWQTGTSDQLLDATRGALRPRARQLGVHLLRGHRVLHIRAWRERRGRRYALLHPVGGAVLLYPVPLGEIQHRHLVFALGIRHQPSGEDPHRYTDMMNVVSACWAYKGLLTFVLSPSRRYPLFTWSLLWWVWKPGTSQ